MTTQSVTSASQQIPDRRQLMADVNHLQTLLQVLQQSNPQATPAETQEFVTAGTSCSVRERLVAALVAGGRTALEAWLDQAYVKVALAVIEGWRG